MTALPPRFAITPAEIDLVVAHFYAAVRAHAVLAPVFAAHVGDWPAHEARIASFWRNVILHDRGYQGSPMAAHLRAGNVAPAMFADWLALFDRTLGDSLPPEAAAGWSAIAHRIGASLRMGLAERAPGSDAPPVLR